MSPTLPDLSSALADLVSTAAPSVVRVDGGPTPVSGVAWDATTVVTVRHGVEEDTPLSVTTHDGVTHRATLLGHDPRLDLSFLSVEGVELPARPSPAAAPQVGALVVTVGRTPRGLRSSLGIVGAVGPAWRTRGGAEVPLDIDVDATLHPAAAGGPLLDAHGHLLGVNTTGLRPGGATLPVAAVEASLQQVRAHGSIRPGLLGVRVRTTALPPGLAAEHGQHQGLLVLGTPRRSPAARAGVETGDVLLTVSGTPVHTLLDLRTTLSTAGGTDVAVTLLRSGEARTLRIPVLTKPHRGGGGWGHRRHGHRHDHGHGHGDDGRGEGRPGPRGPWRRSRRCGPRWKGPGRR